MNKLITLLLVALAVNVNAAYVLWFGIDQNAVVWYENAVTRKVNEFDTDNQLNTVRLSEYHSADFVMNLTLYWEGPGGYPITDEDSIDSNIVVYDAQTGEVKLTEEGKPMLIDWSPAAVADNPNDRRDNKIVMEIGYMDLSNYDENDPSTWDIEFQRVAFAYATIGELIDEHHIYETFDLNPPIEYPWRPINFYTYSLPIPEPSSFSLFALGTLCFIRRRKGVNKA